MDSTELEALFPFCRTDSQHSQLRMMIVEQGVKPAARKLGVSYQTLQGLLRNLRNRRDHGTYQPANRRRVKNEPTQKLDTSAKLAKVEQAKSGVYVITCAQNATPVFDKGFASLQVLCKRLRAHLIVIPMRYHNPTSQWSEKDETNEWWAAQVTPHLLDHRIDIGEHLTILGDVRVQPTAARPTSGMETFCGGRSAIIGHPKLEMVTIPAPQHSSPKTISTTGAITVDNYTDSKAGKKGEHHHTFGALVVEVDDKTGAHYSRQINIDKDTGEFYDLDSLYTPDSYTTGHAIAGLVLGDLHERFVDPSVVSATFTAKNSLLKSLKPQALAFHDVADFYSQNHHHRGKVFTKIAKHRGRQSCVEDEINECAAFVDKHTEGCPRVIFVPSNHPDALQRWIEETDWRQDPENCIFYLETALAIARSAQMGDSGAEYIDPFVYWMEQKLKFMSKYEFPSRDDSVTIAGIEVGMHGDKGPNGARGAIRGFGRVGVKSIIGHSHTPGVMDGVYQVGTSSRLRLEYNSGPSSWMHTHCIVYPNGKRALITIINGKWRR